jgi:hypothetical protein
MAITKLKKIAVHETVYQQLKQLGSAGDSFNDVIVRILSTIEQTAEEGEKKMLGYDCRVRLITHHFHTPTPSSYNNVVSTNYFPPFFITINEQEVNY